jgi:hypothetical protein
MAPKKAANSKTEKAKGPEQGQPVPNISTEPPSKKHRKNSSTDESSKAPRRSGRGAAKTTPSTKQLLQYLLSKSSEELCRPDEESEDIKARGNIKTYSGSVLTPFEELLSAVILSRPISHRLGLRTIRTVFNDPYNFNSARSIQQAGHEKHLKAVYDARTQHKDKTAAQIGQIADVVLENYTNKDDKDGNRLQKLLDNHNGNVDNALDELQRNINGLGNTGVKIFLRRVQWLWSEGFPYVDDRTQHSLLKVGLPTEGSELAKLIDENYKDLDTIDIAGKDEAEKKRRTFVTVLERAIGSDLEGKVDQMLAATTEA